MISATAEEDGNDEFSSVMLQMYLLNLCKSLIKYDMIVEVVYFLPFSLVNRHE
jgi:hypothetical protein